MEGSDGGVVLPFVRAVELAVISEEEEERKTKREKKRKKRTLNMLFRVFIFVLSVDIYGFKM